MCHLSNQLVAVLSTQIWPCGRLTLEIRCRATQLFAFISYQLLMLSLIKIVWLNQTEM